jgi:hypothetical protein
MMMGSRKYRRRSIDGTRHACQAVLGLVGRRKWMFYDEDFGYFSFFCSLTFNAFERCPSVHWLQSFVTEELY